MAAAGAGATTSVDIVPEFDSDKFCHDIRDYALWLREVHQPGSNAHADTGPLCAKMKPHVIAIMKELERVPSEDLEEKGTYHHFSRYVETLMAPLEKWGMIDKATHVACKIWLDRLGDELGRTGTWEL